MIVAVAHLTRRFAQSKTEEGRRAAYFERRRRELAEAVCPHPGDGAVGPEPWRNQEEPPCEGGLQRNQVEDQEESFDVLQLRFLVELAQAPPGPHAEPAAAVHRLGSAGCLMLGAPEASAQPVASDMLMQQGSALDRAGSLGVVGAEASPLQQPLLASAQQPTWRQQPALPPRAAARQATAPLHKHAGAQDMRIFPLASFDVGFEATAGAPEPMVTMPFVPAAPDADVQFTTPAASPRASPVRESNAWLVAAADAGAAAIAAGQGFRTPPRVAWAGSDDDEAEAAQLDATVSLLLEHGGGDALQHEDQRLIQTDFAGFAAQRRAALRLGDVAADAGFQRRDDGGLLPTEDRSAAYAADSGAVRMQRSHTKHMGNSWPMMVTTEERLEVSFYPAQQDAQACVAEHRPAPTSCRITECDDEEDDGLSDLGMLLAQRKRDVVGNDTARCFHMPAALLGDAADSPAALPVQQASEALEAACAPSQLLSPQLTSPPILMSPTAGGGGGEVGAWAAAARIAQELTVGPYAAAAPEQAPPSPPGAAGQATVATAAPCSRWLAAAPPPPRRGAAPARRLRRQRLRNRRTRQRSGRSAGRPRC